MFLISYGRAETNFKVKANELQNIGVSWYKYQPIYKRKLVLAQTEFVYAVLKFRPETEFFVTIGEIQYTYNIVMLEDCDANRIVAIAAQPFGENGRLDAVQINWYI